ncbi:hypothetical protein E2562_015855 [Oryza meyeriana var. granulata]|uniref:Uncharacterized protein n=1 Tax=Oryza meyeriana var. granulata TaxID=110450 RepID=A0A6G1D4R9_9ORYZ|nr:hypothetical protein E2562_015855 [Oryza meyeriana var. granulata]
MASGCVVKGRHRYRGTRGVAPRVVPRVDHGHGLSNGVTPPLTAVVTAACGTAHAALHGGGGDTRAPPLSIARRCTHPSASPAVILEL